MIATPAPQVEACGYTIAPLQARYQAAGLSSECLVTMVLKLNPGGKLNHEIGWILTSNHAASMV